MSIAHKTYTIDEYMLLPDTRNGQLIELVNGEIEEKAMPGMQHTRIEKRLLRHMDAFVTRHTLGEVCPGDADFVLDPFGPTVRKPDVAFVSARHNLPETRGPYPIPPDLAVEIMSPRDYDHPKDVADKVAEYRTAQVSLVWVIDPEAQSVAVYHPDTLAPHILGIDDTLDGEAVVPGFRLAVKTLFDDEA